MTLPSMIWLQELTYIDAQIENQVTLKLDIVSISELGWEAFDVITATLVNAKTTKHEKPPVLARQ